MHHNHSPQAPPTASATSNGVHSLPPGAPNGISHIQRLSMKKFKFQGHDIVYFQCKIRACAQQPCGVCRDTRRQLAPTEDIDLLPMEGEQYSPIININIGRNDRSAMLFPPTQPPAFGNQVFVKPKQGTIGGRGGSPTPYGAADGGRMSWLCCFEP